MALPTTSLSFSALQTEFGGFNPISLSEYVRGGAFVPAGTTSAFGTIPTTNSNISLGLFRGTTKVVGVTMTTGSTQTIVSGGKGTAGYSLFTHGYSESSGTYQDYDNYYNIGYAPIGSASGYFPGAGGLQFLPVEITWHSFTSEDAELGYYERKVRIVVTGNIGAASGGPGSYGTAFTPYVNGTAIGSATSGEWGGAPGAGGSGQTVFTWINGIRPNSSQMPIPGSDAVVPNTNPFGANGSTPLITLV